MVDFIRNKFRETRPPFPPTNLTTIESIFMRHNTDKCSTFHNYSRQYETLFRVYIDKPIKLLEIGVYKGGSISAWRDVFPNAVTILGVDIDYNCKQYQDIGRNIHVEIGDATRPEFIKEINDKYGPFDIILDDGSHNNSHVIQSFEILFPLLKDEGLYVVEDTICYKSTSHIDKNYPNHLEYFMKFIPFLNQWRYDSAYGIQDHCVDPFKIMKKTTNVFERSIDKIDFGVSFIAISKKVRWHWI